MLLREESVCCAPRQQCLARLSPPLRRAQPRLGIVRREAHVDSLRASTAAQTASAHAHPLFRFSDIIPPPLLRRRRLESAVDDLAQRRAVSRGRRAGENHQKNLDELHGRVRVRVELLFEMRVCKGLMRLGAFLNED